MDKLDDLFPAFIGDESLAYPGLPFTKTVERLLRKIAFSENVLRHRGPCWLWQGRLNRNGYGRSWYAPANKEIVCHRILWLEMVGPIPRNQVLDHLCRERRCCSPWHLEPVSHQVNTARGQAVLYKRREQYQPSFVLQDPDS